MARTTFQNTLTELLALLADTDGNPVSSLSTAGVKKVYPHEPGATGVVKPCSVTIDPAGMDPTEWRIMLRVYVSGDLPPEASQDRLIDVPVAIDALLTAGYGPSRWEFAWDDEIQARVALCELMVGREDGF